MKGCAFFAGLFVIGLGLMATGLIQDLMIAGVGFQDQASGAQQPQDRGTARLFEVIGLAVVFGAIFGAAGWRFYTRERDEDEGPRRLR